MSDIVAPIILNNTMIVNDNFNNRMQYNFPSGSIQCRNASLSLKSVDMFFSWYNISSAYNNNVFEIIFPTSTTPTTVTVTIPDGYYTIEQLNAYLEQVLILNNLYLVNSSGQYVYYLQMLSNPNSYALQLVCYAVPTSLPSGWSNPGSMTFPATATTPQFTILSNSFTTWSGLTAGTYPAVAQATTYSINSQNSPQVNPISSIIVLCSMVDNYVNTNPSVIDTFTPTTSALGSSFGSLISYRPNELLFVPVRDASYNTFQLTFLDQNYNNIHILDSNITASLILKFQRS